MTFFLLCILLGCYAMLCNLAGVLLCYAVMKNAPQSNAGKILSILDRIFCKRIADYLEKSASAHDLREAEIREWKKKWEVEGEKEESSTS